MQVDTAKLKVSTKNLVGSLIAAGALFQVPIVHDGLLKFAGTHPHWAGAIGTVLGVYGVLHNPQVQDVLASFGFKRTRTVETEEVTLPEAPHGD